MAAKTMEYYLREAERLGAKVQRPSLLVDFPDGFRIKNKVEALLVLDILNSEWSGSKYTVGLETPYAALREAIARGTI